MEVIAKWIASGIGSRAESHIYKEDGIIKYAGHSATGNSLRSPHFKEEKKEYGYIARLIGKPDTEYKNDPAKIKCFQHLTVKVLHLCRGSNLSHVNEEMKQRMGVRYIPYPQTVNSFGGNSVKMELVEFVNDEGCSLFKHLYITGN